MIDAECAPDETTSYDTATWLCRPAAALDNAVGRPLVLSNYHI